MSTTSQGFIGVVVAIIGNLLISIALNIQKLVHKSIEASLEHDSPLLPSLAQPVKGENFEYLNHRLWWLGMAIMIFGEIGNFAAYGFAPAVLVSPLGTVALVRSSSNVDQ